MLRFITVRLGLIVITLLVVSVVIFAVTEMLPGDAAEIVMGRNATAQNSSICGNSWALTAPLPSGTEDWIWGVVQGDFGESSDSKTPSHGSHRAPFSAVHIPCRFRLCNSSAFGGACRNYGRGETQQHW